MLRRLRVRSCPPADVTPELLRSHPAGGYHQPLHGGCGNRVDALHHGSGRGRGLLEAASGTSGATVLMGVVRLGTIAAAMVALSPLLSLVAALAVVPVVLVTRYFQVRVRDAERASRQAVGLQIPTSRRCWAVWSDSRARQRGHSHRPVPAALCDGLAAYNRATVYSALYIP